MAHPGGRTRTVDVMATSVLHRGAPTRPYRRVPWSPRAWGQALYLAGGIPAQLAPLLLVVLVSLARPIRAFRLAPST